MPRPARRAAAAPQLAPPRSTGASARCLASARLATRCKKVRAGRPEEACPNRSRGELRASAGLPRAGPAGTPARLRHAGCAADAWRRAATLPGVRRLFCGADTRVLRLLGGTLEPLCRGLTRRPCMCPQRTSSRRWSSTQPARSSLPAIEEAESCCLSRWTSELSRRVMRRLCFVACCVRARGCVRRGGPTAAARKLVSVAPSQRALRRYGARAPARKGGQTHCPSRRG